jgi:uncharacterized membrane protein YdjX (TVP38/TMEM64 family)
MTGVLKIQMVLVIRKKNNNNLFFLKYKYFLKNNYIYIYIIMINLCLPSILYFITYIIFAISGYIYFKKYSLINFIGDFIMLFFFTWLLNYLCNTNYKSVSWILFVIFIIITVIGIIIIKNLNLSYDDIHSDPILLFNK